jgi:1,4-alpha-glucan branching enzyme
LSKGYIAIVLHAHLPYVHHPEQDDYLEERWLFEAISETYIPLITNFEKLLDEGIDFRITISFTPPLLSMLSNPLLQNRYIRYLERLIELCEKEKKVESYTIGGSPGNREKYYSI